MINSELTQSYPLEYCPNILGKINFYRSQVIISQAGKEISLKIEENSRKRLEKLFFMMDGTNTVEQLQQKLFPQQPEVVNSVLQSLDKQGLIDRNIQMHLCSGIDTILELQDLSKDLLDNKFNIDRLWQSLALESSEIKSRVLYGFAIEHYYLFNDRYLNRSSCSGLQNYDKIKQLIERVSFQSDDRDFLIQALNAIDCDREKLANIIPLSETMGLSNALAYWANFDSIFSLVTVGFLSEQIRHNLELYLQACEQTQLDEGFIQPIRELVNAMLFRHTEDIGVQIFKEISYIDRETKQRLINTTHLFIEIYSNFYQGIWNHYSSSNLVREIAAI